MNKKTTVFYNGAIFTANPEQPWAEALVVEGEQIAFVGGKTNALAFASHAASKIDLKGRFVIPGFHDAHLHFAEGGFGLIGLNLRKARSLGQFVEILAEYLHSIPEGEWVTSWGWDHKSWPENRYPTRRDVDPVSPRHPLLLQRLDGHVALANSLALEKAGLRHPQKIPGGEIEVDPQTGLMTGILKDKAIDRVAAHIPPAPPARRRRALRAALALAARLGVTSLQEMETHPDSFRVYREWAENGELSARIRAVPLPEHIKNLSDWTNTPWLSVGGVKLFADGSLGATSAWMFEPYNDAPQNTGLAIYAPKELQELIAEFQAKEKQICLHAIGDRANHEAVRALCQAISHRGNTPRHRIEHVQVIREEDVRAMVSCGIVASVQPVHYLDDRRWLVERIGEQRLPAAYRLRTFFQRKIPVAFGTDWPVEELNPLQGIFAAVSRNHDLWTPQEGISLQDALLAYTRGSAFAEFTEKWKGALAPNFAADFVVLSENLFKIPPEEIPNVEVVRTVVGGKTVFEA